MISSDPDKFRCLVRAGKPYLEFLALLKYLLCSLLISSTEDTEKPAEMISCWESFQSSENILCKKMKGKNNPNFFKIFYFYTFGGSVFLCLFEKICCGGVLKSITCSNINFDN